MVVNEIQKTATKTSRNLDRKNTATIINAKNSKGIAWH